MALADQINVVACGAGELLGTGQQACTFDWDRIRAIELSRNGYVYTDELSLENIHEAQQKEEIFIINGFETFAQIEAAPTISTSDGSGLESVDGEMPYKFEGTFKNKGMNFWKALRRFNSSGAYNIAFYDIKGNKVMTQSKGGLIQGFSVNMLFTDKYKGKEGNTAATFKITIQLSDDLTQMERATWVTGDSVDYSISDLDGYNDVSLTPSPLTVGATSLVVKALLVDKSHFANGMVLADFIIKKAGVVVTATNVTLDEVSKTYTFTIPAATAGSYTVETTNDFDHKVVLLPSTGILYKGITGTVIAA